MAISIGNFLERSSKFMVLSRPALMQIRKPYSSSNRFFMRASAIHLQYQCLRTFSSFSNSSPSPKLKEKIHILSDSPQWVKLTSSSHFKAYGVYKAEISSSTNRSFLTSPLGLVLFGMAFLVAYHEVKAEEAIDAESKRMYDLLYKSPRSVEESIELFNYLLRKGEEEISKAKNKDVVIFFGNTDAGKSTLINFLSGCQMKRDGDHIVVDPESPIKEEAKIGTTRDSCTFIPKKISDISISFLNEALVTEDGAPLAKEKLLTIYDMPGLDDNRGIEVALANVIIAKKLIENAKSARLVMVVEKNVIMAKKGTGWVENIELLESIFSRNIGTGEKSLCVVVTKTENLDEVKRKIEFYTPKNSTNLLPYVQIYDPLDSKHRDILLEVIRTTRAHTSLHSKITMNEKQLWKAFKLGERVSGEVMEHLNSGEEREIDKAVQKVQFTYGIASLDNTDLQKPHNIVKDALKEYASAKYIKDIDPENPFQTQIQSLRGYKKFRGKFKNFVDFDSSDKIVRNYIQKTTDPRRYYDKPENTLECAAITSALVFGTFFCPWFALPAFLSGLATGNAATHWWNPDQNDKDRAEFAQGI